MTKLLGIDYGTERVGAALSNEEGTMAFPYEVFPNNSGLIGELKQLILKERVAEIVLGQSLNYRGEPNLVMEKIERFKQVLATETGLPIHFENETLTSAAAARLQGEGKKLDASSAALILDSFLQKRNN